jgi:hypothetical protein
MARKKVLAKDAVAVLDEEPIVEDAPPALDIVINLEGLSLWDLGVLMRAGANTSGQMSPEDTIAMIELLDRVIEGGARTVPFTRMGEVAAALGQAVWGLTSPNSRRGSQPRSGRKAPRP